MPIDLSIVTTLYYSASFISPFIERATRTAQAFSPNFEIILVNDGSPDASLTVALDVQAHGAPITIVDLSRNFGHHQALRLGLSYATGKKVFLLDSDLEESPEWFALFNALLEEKKCDVVYGVQRKRKGKWLERQSGQLFYWLFNHLSGVSIPENSVTARLMTRRYVDAVLAFEERALFLPGLWELAGFQQYPCLIDKGFRHGTTYSLFRRFSLAVNALTSFSDRPLVFIFYTGVILIAVSLLLILTLVYLKCFHGIPLMGWPSLIVSIWFLGGIIIFFIGVLGIYLAKLFVEMKRRPLAIVQAVHLPSGATRS